MDTYTSCFSFTAFVLGYCWYSAVESTYYFNKRKNLKDYANEVDPNLEPPPPPPVEEKESGKKKCK